MFKSKKSQTTSISNLEKHMLEDAKVIFEVLHGESWRDTHMNLVLANQFLAPSIQSCLVGIVQTLAETRISLRYAKLESGSWHRGAEGRIEYNAEFDYRDVPFWWHDEHTCAIMLHERTNDGVLIGKNFLDRRRTHSDEFLPERYRSRTGMMA